MEHTFASGEEPIRGINQALADSSEFLSVASASAFGKHLGCLDTDDEINAESNVNVEEVTGEHYGRLFESFNAVHYWKEPLQLLSARLSRNAIAVPDLGRKRVLDAGCGGGRYTVAWRLLGAREVFGIDISESGIADATRRVRLAQLDGVLFLRGNVLAIPFPDNTFDVVFSNGVLHHTVDWQLGVT